MKILAFSLVAAISLMTFGITQASLISPDGASASSTFSGSYDIGNAIDGSGLPANFTPADAHATYTTNNHWTTRNRETVGQFADFTFNTPQTLGVFYLWNHRSNNIASNDDYEVTRFTLDLYDAADNLLLSLPNLAAAGETATAQTYTFPTTADISRVRFTILETQQQLQVPANSVQYTGVAEVAFAVPEPASAGALLSLSAILLRRRHA